MRAGALSGADRYRRARWAIRTWNLDGLGSDVAAEPFLRGLTEPTGPRLGVGAALTFELIER